MVVPPSSNPWLAAAIRLRDRATGRLRPVLNGSIRRLLILLVLIAILPALGIILLTGFEARNHALIESERNAQLLARGIGEIQERTTRGIHQLLEQLADLPQVKAGNIAVAADSFKSITAAFPMVENLVLTGPDGDVIAAAAPTERTSLIDLPSFRQAMARGTFTAGAFPRARPPAPPAPPPPPPAARGAAGCRRRHGSGERPGR